MTPRKLQLSQALALALLAGSVSACASGGVRERENVQYVDEPATLLYNRAADALDRGRYPRAITMFEEVERQHPYSSWARRAMLMEAYTHYQAQAYDDSIEDAQRFISLHPGNSDAPYAYYLIAICHFERIMDVGRDQGTTERALAALNDVVRRYPDSPYARDSRLKLDMVYDQLAGKEMAIGRFYLERDQHLAAINRFRNVIENENFQRTTHVPEALHRLVESYLSVGMTEEAQRMASILGYNFPGSEWYQRTYALMTEEGVAPVAVEEAERRGWLRRTFGRVL
ncbi:MAG: outer membrane protein assembly factor BamD [Caulobacteraceae bacterium]|nr:outer membrane protein assembly factor BamD [Caulobacteraceae bacterium]MBK8543945.1 outer membrane protein assembly factor BamD [Caulobacteraceae bacterium]